MIPEGHPYYFLSSLCKKTDSVFFLSKYIYTPDSLFDERVCFSIEGKYFSAERIEQEIASLKLDQEVAIHSKIQIKGRAWHIPMIDFSTEDELSGEVFDRMSLYLPKTLMLNMAVYASGRSYHAYSTTLLSPKEWLDFMGRLLLINPRNKKELIDSRWVGHRLVGGFCSLRWSNNSGQYKGMPTRVAFPS